MKKKVLVLVTSLVMLAACAAKTPDWIDGESSAYPQKDYLVGVGVGDTMDGARSAAGAEIAKIFQSRIVQPGGDSRKEGLTEEGAMTRYPMKQDRALSTAPSTGELLQGVEIAESWQNEKNKTYYALAVLDKQKARQALTQQILAQEELVADRLALANSAGSLLEKLRTLNSALEAMNRKDALNARKRVLDPVAAADYSTSGTRASVEKQRAELASRVRFVVHADDTPRLAEKVSEKITGLGFTTLPAVPALQGADTLVLLVSAKTTISFVDRNNLRWVFYNWHGTLSITDATDRAEAISTVVREGQASHLTDSAARAKATEEAVQAVAGAAGEEISRYFYGR